MPSRAPIHRPPHQPEPEEYDRLRGSAASRGYGYRWRKVRAAVLAQRPACEHPGCDQAATDVDHRTPHKGDQSLMWDMSNLQPLCHAHHSLKTATETFGRR
jgi:5-methylcytosine-specific restriction protein A